MDTTTRRVRSLVLSATAYAYGAFASASRDVEGDVARFCECDHHETEHHGEDGRGPCSATGCHCRAWRRRS